MDVAALEQRLLRGDVGTVVVTLGTTATGAVDPLDQLLDLRQRYTFRIHVDAAYGGYFVLASNLAADAARAFACVAQADSMLSIPTSTGCSPTAAAASCLCDPG